MKVLVVAYEFPPSPSAQSIRWSYLARELAARGHDVHVMVPDAHYGRMNMPFDADGVTVHRTFAGPVVGMVARAARVRGEPRNAVAPAPDLGSAAATAPSTKVELNWKGRIFKAYQRVANIVLFPDVRAEWGPWARRALKQLLRHERPDVVITSHEPASTLHLGALAQRLGVKWVADLGDPVLAGYTPWHKQRRALRLEALTCRNADAVVVTDERAQVLLASRHGLDAAAIDVVTQGYPQRQSSGRQPTPADMEMLDLAYTGSLYAFRPIEPLLAAVTACPGVRLHVATTAASESLATAARRNPSRFILHGHLSHQVALELQESCDAVVNIANRLEAQVPGKLYEYLSSGRPILHLRSADDDPGSRLVRRLARGWDVANEATAIRALLEELVLRKSKGTLLEGLDLGESAITPFRWDELARKYETILRRATA